MKKAKGRLTATSLRYILIGILLGLLIGTEGEVCADVTLDAMADSGEQQHSSAFRLE